MVQGWISHQLDEKLTGADISSTTLRFYDAHLDDS